MSRKVFILDTTLRDGEQSPGASLNEAEKLQIALQLEILGVDIIEAGFPASSRGDFMAVKQVSQNISNSVICALARCKKDDIEKAWRAIEGAKKPMIHTFIGTSDIQVFDVLKKTRDEIISMVRSSVRLARSLCREVEFSAMDATRTSSKFLNEVIEVALGEGATVINIPDTVGYALPVSFGELITSIYNHFPEFHTGQARLSVHCHDDLGLATANSLIAIINGVQQVEATINGIGERAGNTAMEEIVASLIIHEAKIKAFTDVNIHRFADVSKLVSRLMNSVIPPNKSIAGTNAFKHSSGIHQDGELKNEDAFSLFKPEQWGYREDGGIVLTARSGRAGIEAVLGTLGYHFQKDQLLKIVEEVKKLGDLKGDISEDDLIVLAENELSIKGPFSLEYFYVQNSTDKRPSANVGMMRDGWRNVRYEYIQGGDGQVDAAFQAIAKIVGIPLEVIEYKLLGVGPGQKALGKVILKARNNGNVVVGVGVDTDIVIASAKAYINAVNKTVLLRGGE